eukprot:9442417-Alexandrium_andersonii.AAC.1
MGPSRGTCVGGSSAWRHGTSPTPTTPSRQNAGNATTRATADAPARSQGTRACARLCPSWHGRR